MTNNLTPEQIDELANFLDGYAVDAGHGAEKFENAAQALRQLKMTMEERNMRKDGGEFETFYREIPYKLRNGFMSTHKTAEYIYNFFQAKGDKADGLRRAAEIADGWSSNVADRPVWTVARDIKQAIINEANNQQGEET